MPIKIQSDLPAKGILENENIFVMDEGQSNQSGNQTVEDLYSESDAAQGRNRASASESIV